MRRTKIVATVSPASRDPEVLVRMTEAGMDVARLNFSHGAPHSLDGSGSGGPLRFHSGCRTNLWR
jgi:pyruvate kinase